VNELERRSDGSIDLSSALERIRAAHERLRAHVRTTPIVPSSTFSEGADREVVLKLENLQRTGSFKVRGALNKLFSLPTEALDRGLVAASAGNHAQGVAFAAKLLGTRATIVMPEATALIKIRRTEDYGAEVVLHGESWDEAQTEALALAERRGLTPVHPFDDPEVIVGQGTLALEVLDELSELEAIVVPIGGGGLAAGVALAVKALRPEVRVVGVQAEGAAPTVRSLRQGAPVRVERPRTIAEGIRVGTVGQRTFPIVRELVDDCVTVTEEEITDALVQCLQKSKVVAEAAGAVPLAALAGGHVRGRGRVCAVLSGGNIDLNQLGRIIESGLANAGFYLPLRLRVPDVPGQLRAIVAVLAETRTNIVDVQHYRAGWQVPVGWVDVEILVETRSADQGPAIEALLRERGFRLV